VYISLKTVINLRVPFEKGSASRCDEFSYPITSGCIQHKLEQKSSEVNHSNL
jgi:hypothetical protein